VELPLRPYFSAAQQLDYIFIMMLSIAFIAYAVKDVAASRRFYEEALGLQLTQNPNSDWFEYDLGDTTFVITSADTEHPVPVRGALVAFEIDNLDDEIARLRKIGVTIKGEIGESPICRYASILDPDGTELLIHQRKG
jgi:predicted enzyme related to lactoylglutathione lyase